MCATVSRQGAPLSHWPGAGAPPTSSQPQFEAMNPIGVPASSLTPGSSAPWASPTGASLLGSLTTCWSKGVDVAKDSYLTQLQKSFEALIDKTDLDERQRDFFRT